MGLTAHRSYRPVRWESGCAAARNQNGIARDCKYMGYLHKLLKYSEILHLLQCTPCAWDTTLGHDIVKAIVNFSQF